MSGWPHGPAWAAATVRNREATYPPFGTALYRRSMLAFALWFVATSFFTNCAEAALYTTRMRLTCPNAKLRCQVSLINGRSQLFQYNMLLYGSWYTFSVKYFYSHVDMCCNVVMWRVSRRSCRKDQQLTPVEVWETFYRNKLLHSYYLDKNI